MLKQEGTVWEYIRDFIALASNAPKVTDTVLEMAFTIGLKPQIKAGIKLMEPRSLRKMMSVAKLVEEWGSYANPSLEIQNEKGFPGGSQSGSTLLGIRSGPSGGNGPGSNSSPRPKTFQSQEKTAPVEKKPATQNPNSTGRNKTLF